MRLIAISEMDSSQSCSNYFGMVPLYLSHTTICVMKQYNKYKCGSWAGYIEK